VGQFEPRFQGKGSSLWNIFWFLQSQTHLLSDSANCAVLCAVVLTQYRRVTNSKTDGRTDGRTDGIALQFTALAMRALRRAAQNFTLGTIEALLTIRVRRHSYVFPNSNSNLLYNKLLESLLHVAKKYNTCNRARQLYKNISMLFLFPVKRDLLFINI